MDPFHLQVFSPTDIDRLFHSIFRMDAKTGPADNVSIQSKMIQSLRNRGVQCDHPFRRISKCYLSAQCIFNSTHVSLSPSSISVFETAPPDYVAYIGKFLNLRLNYPSMDVDFKMRF